MGVWDGAVFWMFEMGLGQLILDMTREIPSNLLCFEFRSVVLVMALMRLEVIENSVKCE